MRQAGLLSVPQVRGGREHFQHPLLGVGRIRHSAAEKAVRHGAVTTLSPSQPTANLTPGRISAVTSAAEAVFQCRIGWVSGPDFLDDDSTRSSSSDPIRYRSAIVADSPPCSGDINRNAKDSASKQTSGGLRANESSESLRGLDLERPIRGPSRESLLSHVDVASLRRTSIATN
jgi:hypothetical protein